MLNESMVNSDKNTSSSTRRRKRRRAPVHQGSLPEAFSGPKQQRYLLVLQETSRVGKLLSQKEIAEAVGVTEQVVCRWKRKPGFIEAMNQVIREGLRTGWLQAEYAAAGRAARGNLMDWKLYLEHGGPTSWRDAQTSASPSTPGDGATAINGTHIHIHSIPEPASRSTLPPPLELPGTKTAATPSGGI